MKKLFAQTKWRYLIKIVTGIARLVFQTKQCEINFEYLGCVCKTHSLKSSLLLCHNNNFFLNNEHLWGFAFFAPLKGQVRPTETFCC